MRSRGQSFFLFPVVMIKAQLAMLIAEGVMLPPLLHRPAHDIANLDTSSMTGAARPAALNGQRSKRHYDHQSFSDRMRPNGLTTRTCLPQSAKRMGATRYKLGRTITRNQAVGHGEKRQRVRSKLHLCGLERLLLSFPSRKHALKSKYE
jgi:hypothetical protein